jgi:hypothetical protein
MSSLVSGEGVYSGAESTNVDRPERNYIRAIRPWYLGREKIMCISEPKSDGPNTLRRGRDQPAAISVHGGRYHHIGIPTDVSRRGEYYLEQFKMYVSV